MRKASYRRRIDLKFMDWAPFSERMRMADFNVLATDDLKLTP